MELENKNVLILGLGVSGVSTVKALNKLGANIIISDSKKEDELKDFLKSIELYSVKLFLGTNDVPLDDIDLIVKSPGIPLDIPIIEKAKKLNIEVITDIELAYRIIPKNKFIAITGTNGKTTTTTLMGEILKKAGYSCHITGN
ncbi:UDP-N-acetylmuramoyl-L-alanine--D-glutamate ligase, partial [Anaerosalibacter bizertensis]|nr:UDP-N-acetylmuramoyl-L-alanine--D-glutamate ligase [Anaerosalibacter bizertensis]